MNTFFSTVRPLLLAFAVAALSACGNGSSSDSGRTSVSASKDAAESKSTAEPPSDTEKLLISAKNAVLPSDQAKDVETLRREFTDAGFGRLSEKEAEWNQRLVQAERQRSSDGLKSVLREQLAAFTDLNKRVSTIRMKSREGEAVRQKIAGGSAKMMQALSKANSFPDLYATGVEAELESELARMKQGAAEMAQGMEDYHRLLTSQGYSLKDENSFRQKMDRVKEMTR